SDISLAAVDSAGIDGPPDDRLFPSFDSSARRRAGLVSKGSPSFSRVPAGDRFGGSARIPRLSGRSGFGTGSRLSLSLPKRAWRRPLSSRHRLSGYRPVSP